MAGRIGALAIRNDGTILLGAAQGGIWASEPTAKAWIAAEGQPAPSRLGALAIAPSTTRRLHGLR